jgi:molybdopterin-guanine dinucleotide biosynthesis protein A
LRAEFVRFLIGQLEQHDVVVPVEGEFHHPLAAVYRTTLVDEIADMLAHDQLRMISFYEQVNTRRIDVQELRAVDPELHSLLNINRPEDYQTALRLARSVSPETDPPGAD